MENIQNIIQFAMLKYKLKSRTVMNTYILHEIEKRKLTAEQTEQLLNNIDFYINTLNTQKEIEKKENFENGLKDCTFTINGITYSYDQILKMEG